MDATDEKYVTKQTASMLDEVMRFLNQQEKVKGTEVIRSLSNNFLASFIGARIYLTLKARPANIKSNQQMVDYCTRSFAELKVEIQNSVAAGFQGAMQEYTGQPAEYYCQVKLVPEAVNKEPC